MNDQGDQEQQLRRLIHEKTRGVRAGGFRQVAYSDNHQEIAQKQHTLSHEMNNMIHDPENEEFLKNVQGQEQEIKDQSKPQEQDDPVYMNDDQAAKALLQNIKERNKKLKDSLDNKEGPQQPQDSKKSPEKLFEVDKTFSQHQKTPSKQAKSNNQSKAPSPEPKAPAGEPENDAKGADHKIDGDD